MSSSEKKNTHFVTDTRFRRDAWVDVQVQTPCQTKWMEVPAIQLKMVDESYRVSCPICRESQAYQDVHFGSGGRHRY